VSTDPFAWVTAASARTVSRAAGVLTVVLMLTIQSLAPALTTPLAPLGIGSLQLATSPASAAAIVASWDGPALGIAALTHGIDLVLPFAYALAIGAAARVRGLRSVAARRPARFAGWSAVVAAATDQIENVAMAVTLLGRVSPASVLVTLVAAALKWSALVLALVSLAVAAVRARPSTWSPPREGR
jgi:hypothetical protein